MKIEQNILEYNSYSPNDEILLILEKSGDVTLSISRGGLNYTTKVSKKLLLEFLKQLETREAKK